MSENLWITSLPHFQTKLSLLCENFREYLSIQKCFTWFVIQKLSDHGRLLATISEILPFFHQNFHSNLLIMLDLCVELPRDFRTYLERDESPTQVVVTLIPRLTE